MNLDLKNKIALVCGGSEGLGFASAKEMASLGAHIILLSRNEDKLERAVKELKKINNLNHEYISADTSDLETLKLQISKRVGFSPIHILVNNTGGPSPGNILEEEPEKFIETFKQHVMAAQILTKLLIPGMIESKYGRILNIISTSVRQPLSILAVSNTIRGAMASWAKSLSLELAKHKITVNNILPGTIDTSRVQNILKQQMESTGKTKEELISHFIKDIPLGRIGTVDEFGPAVAFLASPAASYITGVSLPVDGGKIKSI